jgi:non-heme chloroperoxidase
MTASVSGSPAQGNGWWQQEFDPLGPTVRQATLPGGRSVHFIDEGRPGWPVVVFFGGAGTTVRAFGLLEFARTLREQLRIRVVSVERNGLGQTAFDPGLGFREYAAHVWELLDQLDIYDASLVAISGGGPYAAHVAHARPDRVRSLHLACAFSERLDDDSPLNAATVAADPVGWWRFPADSAVHRIPGFVDATIEEATRAVFARGRDQAPEGLAQAFALYRDSPLPDLGAVRSPAFLYWGEADRVVTTAHLERWQAALPMVNAVRLYPGEGHDVQYRHWDQILTDLAFLGERVVVTVDGKTLLLDPEQAAQALTAGAVSGLCAWG